MANRYANLVGSNKIKDEYQKINIGFDKVEQEMDEKPDNSFAKINDVEAEGEDAVTIEAGTGITITTTPEEKKIRITATGEATPGPHGSEHNHDGADPIPALDQLRDDYNFHLTDIAAHDITRSATIVIASSTSRNKDQADFVCDGVSDHIQLQQALDSLSTSGGRVILLEGIYNFSSFVSFPSNIIVEGQGSSTQIIYPASSGTTDAVWIISGQNNCTIKNLVLDGGGEMEHSGIRVGNSTNVRLEGVTVRNFAGQYAIRLGGAYNIAFRCLTENNTGGGLELNGDYHLAVGCISRNNGRHGIGAVEVYKKRRLIACISIDNGSHGINLNPATSVPSDTQTSVIGCLASGNQGYGIYIPNPGMENVIIDGCHLSGNVQGNLLDNGTNTIIGDNYIEEA